MNLHKVQEIELRNAAEGVLVQIHFARFQRIKTGPFDNSSLPDSNRESSYRKAMRRWLKSAASLDGKKTPIHGKDLRAIVQVLKNHVHGFPQQKNDVTLIQKALNMRVSVKGNSYTFNPDGTDTPRFIQPVGPQVRFAAEELVRYLRLYAYQARPPLSKPLAVCPCCDGLFLKQRSKQEYCSNDCRFEAWRQDKKQKDPEYWARMARGSRYARKRQKAGKPRGCTKKV